ncbi:2-octaprenylphenol hydroxylase [Tamilnaduibacter salinus]|uniref:2-octaprenylphenol hydroxylase n=1 Tax=Tamilnaduibacter salinus TaxID=1484056 RepID=A0A2U1CWY1_9GAMM|nr:UbiH/UbiF/VisC/COQ6 family ubiquinone biosynthesis hydroxylase [Tamilnaduibacter salinus]PVY76515.1 2-octaprenylphenol hydroxylase [Tamilnaduibacter salinus]
MTMSFDILVVGGGLTGTAAALGLVQQGWRVGLVEGAPAAKLTARLPDAHQAADFTPRVSALSPASERLLTELGVWPDIRSRRHCPYQRMEVWDGDGTGSIEFEAAELHTPSLGAIVENQSVVSALVAGFRDSDGVLIDGRTVVRWEDQDGRQALTLDDDRSLTADLIIAADGPQSRLRQWGGLPTREWDYGQEAIVCTVETTQPHGFTAWQRFSPTGPLAFLPLQTDEGDSHCCSIVWSQDTDEARRLMALDDNAFTAELEAAIEQRLGPIRSLSRRYSFPLRQRHAKDYVRPGMALIGDAAHTIHPLAGQGVNLGYSDVRVLLEELQRARRTGLPPADRLLLGRYQRRRKGENLAMMAAMEGFKRLFARDELPLRWVRNAGMRWLDGQSPLKNRIAAEAMGFH